MKQENLDEKHARAYIVLWVFLVLSIMVLAFVGMRKLIILHSLIKAGRRVFLIVDVIVLFHLSTFMLHTVSDRSKNNEIHRYINLWVILSLLLFLFLFFSWGFLFMFPFLTSVNLINQLYLIASLGTILVFSAFTIGILRKGKYI